MSALDQPVAVTFFCDRFAAEKREEQYSFRTLASQIRAVTAAQKSRLPLLKLARFGDKRTSQNSLRHDANVLAVTGVEADYDGGIITFDEALALLEKHGIASILYTSPSHTQDRPRWRALCAFTTETEAARRRHMLGRLNGLFRGVFARESWTLSQAYYLGSINHNPAHRVELIDGFPIDLHDDLDKVWIGPSTTRTERSPDQNATGDERETAELIRRALAGEELHTTLCPLAARLIGRNVPPDIVAELLRAVMLSWLAAARDERWHARFGEIDRLVESARRKFQQDAAIRRDNNRELAALALRLLKLRRPSAEVCDLVRARADALGIEAGRAESILNWAAETERDRRCGAHA